MNLEQHIFQKQLKFFKVIPPKKNTALVKQKQKSLQYIAPEQRKIHDIIRSILKDFQYFSGYQKQQLNLTEGQRVLKMNGIKIIKENDTYFIQKYITKQQSILKRSQKLLQKIGQKSQTIKIQYCRSETLTDPRHFLSLLGYSTKQRDYFQYLDLQCYKCPAYGIQVIIYQNWNDVQYILIESVCNIEGTNLVSALLIDKLGELAVEQIYNEIDPYTLRPKNLKHGILPES